MKRIAVAVCSAILISAVAAAAQTKTAHPGPEYKVLDAWVGNWLVLGEARDRPAGPPYKSEWTFTGKRILGGFFLEVRHREKMKGYVEEFYELTGYDPQKKACVSFVAEENGSWEVSAPTFINATTCVDNGITYFPDGRTLKWRFTWTFAPDGKSLSVKGEYETNGAWWTSYEGKGTKSPEK